MKIFFRKRGGGVTPQIRNLFFGQKSGVFLVKNTIFGEKSVKPNSFSDIAQIYWSFSPSDGMGEVPELEIF